MLYLYASLLSSLLAAFVVILVKQWLEWYLRNASGSMTDRCRVRQLWCDAFDWRFNLIGGSLPVLLHVSTFLFAAGLFGRVGAMLSSTGILVYCWIGVAGVVYSTATLYGLQGTSGYRTPVSTLLLFVQALLRTHHTRWKRYRRSQPTPLQNIQVQRPDSRLKPKDLATIQTANITDVRCVSWVLWKIINPEALGIGI